MKNFVKASPRFWFSLLLLSSLATIFLSACPPQAQNEQKAQEASSAPVPWQWPEQKPAGAEGELVSYGEALIAETPRYLGAQMGNHLACANCHLQKGTQAGAVGFVGISRRYPQHYAPVDRTVTLAERINACFERSLNGQPLKLESREVKAIVAYMDWLSKDIPAGKVPLGVGLPKFTPPQRPASPEAGAKLYQQSCQACHGAQGQGQLQDPAHPEAGYVFPPLAGPDSFSTGSNLARVLIAARYIRANMPLGRPVLTSAEAYDVAAFVNSLPRPDYAQAGKDYPNLKTKPADVPYGPWNSSQSQNEKAHKLGPFAP